ncbi:Hypothetical protein PENO1_077630 [Penicillium occitanis (nom. inval.)]|nr:hypothetical protein PENOC_100280 [Penicillium occitanis (nom. inval.)]PCG94603.1 Hypothetical protein PENO1_077630 [Penicillium occitanis (nom. inval.)]
MARLLRLYSTDHASESGCDQDFLNVTMAIQLLDMYFAPPSIRHINMAWRLLDKHNGSEYTRIVACSDTGQVMRPFGCELQAYRILDGLQQLLYQEGLMNGPSTTQLMSLEGELENMQISFDDHEDISTWRGEIATAAVASLLVRSLIYRQGETQATGQAFNDRPTKILKDIEKLETMSRHQLRRITAEGSVNTMSPFSMTILALGARYIKSLCPCGLIEDYEWSKGNAVVELLQWLSGRWCLAKTPGDFVTYMGAFNVYIRAERLVDYCEYITVQFATVGEKEAFGHIILGLLDKMPSPEEAFEAFIADGDTLEICGEADDTITNYKIDIPA